MPKDHFITSERFVFEGALGVSTAVAIALFLAATAAWMLWRYRDAVGTGWAIVFWALRMVAVGVALWMVVGPAKETIELSTSTQSIAILSDASQSMEIFDPSDPATSLRWQLAMNHEEGTDALSTCDRARVAIRLAKRTCEKSRQQLEEHRPLRKIQRTLAETQTAIQRAIELCNQVEGSLDTTQTVFLEQIEQVEVPLSESVLVTLEDLHAALDDPDHVVTTEIMTSLDALNNGIQRAQRRITRLSSNLADSLIPANGEDQSESFTRRHLATRVLDALEERVLSDLADTVHIRRFQFDEHLQPVAAHDWTETADTTNSHRVTNLTSVLKQLAKDRAADSTRLAVIFSDGHHNDPQVPAPQEVAGELIDLPIYVVPVGNSKTIRDILLHRVEAPTTVVENDSGVIEAIVTAYDCEGMSTDVVLRHDGKEIDRRVVKFDGKRLDRRIQFRVSAEQIGWQEYELSVEPVEDEASNTNNVALLSWEVVRDKLHILLADNISQWEYRYLQQLFRRDSHVEFDELLFHPRLRGTGAMAANPRLPQNVDDWSVYDVVILGDLSPQQFSRASQEALAEYLRQGHGHAIVIAGQNNMPHQFAGQPLIDLLPIEKRAGKRLAETYEVALTDEGRLHSAIAIEDSAVASEASWVNVYRRKPIHRLSTYCIPKSTARTLLHAVPSAKAVVFDEESSRKDQPAFLSWHQVGGGRVVYLSAPQTWVLRFRRGDRMHHRFWGQMLRWVTSSSIGSGSEQLRLITDQTRYQIHEPIEITAWLKDETGRPVAGQSLRVELRMLEGKVATVELESDSNVAGRYFNTLSHLKPGVYEIVATGPAVEKLASADHFEGARRLITIEQSENIEMLDTSCNRPLLEQIAHMTGGQVVPPTAIGEVLRLASLSPEVNETIHRTPLWNRWANLWIILGCLSLEWIVRKRKGLV